MQCADIKTSFLKIAFVADPKTLWTLVDPDAEGLQRLRDAGVRLVSLAPWHDEVLRHWLSDAFHSGPNDKEEREQLSAAWATGRLCLTDSISSAEVAMERGVMRLSNFGAKCRAFPWRSSAWISMSRRGSCVNSRTLVRPLRKISATSSPGSNPSLCSGHSGGLRHCSSLGSLSREPTDSIRWSIR